jgi:hypothetical protein
MRATIRLFVGLVLVAFTLASLHYVPAGFLALLGVQASPDSVRSPTQRSLDAADEEIAIRCERIKAKERIVDLLLTGELGLIPAAAWFEVVNASPPAYPDKSWRVYSGQCDGEKLCRQVIAWARCRLEVALPESAVQVKIRHLEKELHDHIAQHGKVILSER